MKKELRVLIRFNGEITLERSLPLSRAYRVVERGLSEVGKYHGGYADLLDPESGEELEQISYF